MLFNSLGFLSFFIVILLLHNLPFPWRMKKLNLLLASYFFYAAWNPPFILLLWVSTVVDWVTGGKLHKEIRPGRRKAWLAFSLVANLSLLGYFKYGGFLLESFADLMNAIGWAFQPRAPDIVLPVGISFYTFQTLSYTFDMYRRRGEPARRFLDFALFVTFFPQLVAGPIVRPGQLIPQFEKARRASLNQCIFGLGLLTLGLFQQVVIADGLLSTATELVYCADGPVYWLDAWLGTLAFSGQIFCDFAGNSTCAVGIALCLGFSLPNNFRFPYAAIGFSDFWRRWHVSLSSWLKDYLYISLGGNRKGFSRTYVHLMLTMLLGGLWHGGLLEFPDLGRHSRPLSLSRTPFSRLVPCRQLPAIRVSWLPVEPVDLYHGHADLGIFPFRKSP